jgi:hypothetical protein
MYLYEYLTQETLTFILCLQFLFFLQEGFGHGRVPHPQQMGVSTIFHGEALKLHAAFEISSGH